MFRVVLLLTLVLSVVVGAKSQSVPKELLSTPTRLELDRPTAEAKVGSTVIYTVTLKNARDQTVAATSNLALEIQTPSGQKTVQLPAGTSSTTFEWLAETPGIGHMTVSFGKLHPATGLVLVAPQAIARENVRKPIAVNPDVRLSQKASGINEKHLGAEAAIGAQIAGAASVPQAAEPSSAPSDTARSLAKKIRLFVEPLPVYGNAVDHIWKATVSVASLGDGDSLAPVSRDVPIHLNASSGQLSTADIVIRSGEFGNFQNPVVLTADHTGKGSVDAVSSLGPAGPVDVVYLQPPVAQLRLAIGTPVLAGNGTASATVQVCLLDQSGALTLSDEDIPVKLTAPGVLASSVLTVHHGAVCSEATQWSAGPGTMKIQAEASGLKTDAESSVFPEFPSYFVWLSALGGLAGALIVNLSSLSSPRWWRSLILGTAFGVICYLLARFGAVALPEGIDIQKIPVVNGVGSLLIGILGGLFGRKIFKLGEAKGD